MPDRSESLQKTIDWWRYWASTCRGPTEDPPLQDAVVRLAITLKLLTSGPRAASSRPPTSLPEDLGGERNWDYRYCWLRNASLTLYALLNAGYRDEAEPWREWLLRAASGHPDQLHIMYDISGERWLPETTVPWLKGYENSRPVCIGNEAVDQLQFWMCMAR